MNPQPRHANYADAERRRHQLIAVAGELAAITEELGLPALGQSVDTIATRVRNDGFVVTVLGDFNTGKSTLINALLGADILPRLPVEATAVLTEVRWSEEPVAILYPRDRSAPVRIGVDQLMAHIVVDNEAPDVQRPYDRAEVYWPLELCRNNVILVDSPGLNADLYREEQALAYLRVTDAVIFVMSAQQAMKRSEAEFVRAHLGGHDPFFVVNRINQVERAEQGMVRDSVANRLQRVRPDNPGDPLHTFWVDALGAVRAREAGNDGGWEASGVAALERALEGFLVTERHKVKIMVPARMLRALRREIAEALQRKHEMLQQPLQQLAQRYDELQVPLERLQFDAQRVTTGLGNRLAELEDFVRGEVQRELGRLAGELPGLAAASVTDAHLSLKPWGTKEQAEEVAKEIAALSARQVEAAFGEWVTASLAPQVGMRMASIAAELEQHVVEFRQDLASIRLDMSGVAAEAAQVQEGETSVARLVAGIGGQLLAGPAAGFAGLRFGPKEMAKALGPSLAIGVVWMFTPFGLPTLAAALIAQGIFGSSRMLKGAESALKQQVGEQMAREMRSHAYELADKAARNVGSYLVEFQNTVRQGFDRDLATFHQEIEQVLTDKRTGERNAETRRQELGKLAMRLNDAMSLLDEIVDGIAAL